MSSLTPGVRWQPPSITELRALLPAYEFHELLGRGGMGAVFQATQRSLNRPVAIKVLPVTLLENSDANFAARFRMEALTMAKLAHPGIVSVFESGEAGGLLYIVMELVDGTDVARMIAGDGKLAPELAAEFITQVCDALHYAHGRGVIHRDIKPANLLVTRDGTVKIADFGLAKHDDAALQRLTKTNVAIGTPDFLAPEAWMPNAPLDSRADVYALGVTLYQMLTGEVPRGLWKMPSVKAGVDARFDAIIDRAMQPDRDARYQSSAEMRRDLEAIRAGSGDANHRASPRQRWGKAALIAITGVVFVVSILLLLAALRPLKQGNISRSAPLEQIVQTATDGGAGSLRQAILDSTNGGTITFSPKLSGQTILLTNGELVLNKNLTIDASSVSGGLGIDANSNSRVFNIAEGTTNVLTALTIKNGRSAPWQSGGGILNDGHLTVNQSLLVGNYAFAGGGIGNGSNGILTLNRTTLASNSAKFAGGIRIVPNGAVTLNQSTLSGTMSGGGIENNRGGRLTLFNSIVAGNCCAQNGERGSDLYNLGSMTLRGQNILPHYDDDGGRGTESGPVAITNAPLLAPLGSYGGPRMTMPPLPGSPAIDSGAATPFTIDQRGFQFLAGAVPDLGAVELEIPRVVVTNAADTGPGSLRQALADAESNEVQIVTFAPDLAGKVITLTLGEIILRKNVVITAADLPEGITINGDRQFRIFRVLDGANVVLSSMTISNGIGINTGGAGVLVESHGTLTLNECTVVDHRLTAPKSHDSLGGGVAIVNGLLTANRCTFSGNRATSGSGILGINSKLVLNQCTVAGNVSARSGAIHVVRSRLELNHCTVYRNSCDRESPGGVSAIESRLILFNSIVANNRDADEVTRPDDYRGANLTSGDLRLAPLGRYGGPTATMPPMAGSPALDTAVGSAFTTDQRGFPRPVGAAPDIGAVEGTASVDKEEESVSLPGVHPPGIFSGLAAAQWMVRNQLGFTVATDGKELEVTRQQDIPAREFEVVGLRFDRASSDLPQPRYREFQVLRSVTTLRSVLVQSLTGLADDDLAFLSRNARLDSLEIDGCGKLSDDLLKHISGLDRLENLKLTHLPNLIGRGFADAAWLTAVKSARFDFTALDDAAVNALAGCPKLDSLAVVGSTRMTDIGLRVLVRAPVLRVLSVERCPLLTSRGLAEVIPRLVRLEEFNAADTPFGDGCATAISTTLTNLVKLDLSGCPLSDSGLANLATMPRLRTLIVARTRVTAAGRSAFVAQSPECLLEP